MIDALRRRGRRINASIDDFSEVLTDGAAEPDMVAADVGRHLEDLPPGQRNVVRSIAVDGESIGETAARLKMTSGAVRVALHRGLAGARAKVQDGRAMKTDELIRALAADGATRQMPLRQMFAAAMIPGVVDRGLSFSGDPRFQAAFL